MRPQKIEDHDLIIGVMSVIRDKGYEGASLSDLAKASGLQKASLYHRFPGGKKEITQAVLKYIDKWIDSNIINIIQDKNLTPKQRLISVLDDIKVIYENGDKACIIKAVSTNTGLELFDNELKSNMNKWITGFKELALAFKFNETKAEAMGSQVLMSIQGSLIVSKGLKSNIYFLKTLDHIKNMYLKE